MPGRRCREHEAPGAAHVLEGELLGERAAPRHAQHVDAIVPELLEERIAQADENVTLFRDPRPGEKIRTIMIASAFACTGCHQEK